MTEAHQKGLTSLWAIAERELSCAGHDLSHVRRVFATAFRLAEMEKTAGRGAADARILGAATILHDIARVLEDNDVTGQTRHAIKGAEMAHDELLALGWSEPDADHVAACIVTHSFRQGQEPSTLEAKLLHDADKLDCLGAVGIARSFMLAGQFGESIYIDPTAYTEADLKALKGRNTSAYAPNIEFLAKFRYIPQRMTTPSGRAMAEERMPFTETFFEILAQECALEGKNDG